MPPEAPAGGRRSTGAASATGRDGHGAGEALATTARTRLTVEGWVVLALLLGFAAGAFNTGTNLLYLVAALLLNAFVVQLVVVRFVALRGLEVGRRAAERVTVGEPLAVTLSLRDRGGRGRAFPVEVEEVLPPGLYGAPARGLFLGLPAGATAAATAPLRPRRRGRFAGRRLRLRCRAPLGLIEHTREVPCAWRLVVVPRVRPVRAEVLAGTAAAAEGASRRAAWAPERRDLIRGLRELRPGDDLRAIHWRSTARRGDVVVKEFERSAPDAALVLVHLAPADAAAVEAAVTLAASLVAALARGGERVGLAAAGQGPPALVAPEVGSVARRRALDALAAAAPGSDADLGRLTRRAGAHLRSARLFLVTTASGASCAGARVHTVLRPEDAEACFARRRSPSAGGGAA